MNPYEPPSDQEPLTNAADRADGTGKSAVIGFAVLVTIGVAVVALFLGIYFRAT